MWTFPSFESIVQDVRYALRTLLKARGFSIVAILVLAIGIGANTAMFSLVDAMLFRGIPYPDPDRLVLLIGNVQRTTVERRGNSYPDHQDWRAKATRFVDMAAYTTSTMTLMGFDEPERLAIETVSAPYFSVLGVTPALGRTFRPDEDEVPNRDAVVILSDGLWRRRFAADPSIVNRTIQSQARTYTVIGVMPPGFTGISDTAQLWLPFMFSGTGFDNRGNRGFQTIARLKPEATMEQAKAELDGDLETARIGVPGDQRQAGRRDQSAVDRNLRSAAAGRAHSDGRRQFRAADRMRQRRQSPDRPIRDAAARDRRSNRARGWSGETAAAPHHRKLRADDDWRGCRRRRREALGAGADRGESGHVSVVRAAGPQPVCARIHRGGRHSLWPSPRSRASDAHPVGEADGSVEREPRFDRRQVAADPRRRSSSPRSRSRSCCSSVPV